MKRFKNYGFWTALSGALVLFLKTLGEAFGFSIHQETVSNLVMALAELLVVFGIVVMPRNKGDSSSTEEKGDDVIGTDDKQEDEEKVEEKEETQGKKPDDEKDKE